MQTPRSFKSIFRTSFWRMSTWLQCHFFSRALPAREAAVAGPAAVRVVFRGDRQGAEHQAVCLRCHCRGLGQRVVHDPRRFRGWPPRTRLTADGHSSLDWGGPAGGQVPAATPKCFRPWVRGWHPGLNAVLFWCAAMHQMDEQAPGPNDWGE